MKNALNWFEIPVKNFDKAKKFYETILGAELQPMEAMGMKSARHLDCFIMTRNFTWRIKDTN